MSPVPKSARQSPALSSSASQSPTGHRVLDVGCGAHKIPGAVGIDHSPAEGVDVVYDLDCYPWPFPDNAFDRAICRHSLAHLANIVRTMEELHRILRPGGIIEIVTPHFSSDNAFTDVTIRWSFGYRSMDFFCVNRNFKYRYGSSKFDLLDVRISMLQAYVFAPDKYKFNPFKYFGVDALINRFPRFYEHFAAFIVRANEIYYRLQAVK
jgi:SAM-dependent methyltransferase